jgi:hypothetical protein
MLRHRTDNPGMSHVCDRWKFEKNQTFCPKVDRWLGPSANRRNCTCYGILRFDDAVINPGCVSSVGRKRTFPHGIGQWVQGVQRPIKEMTRTTIPLISVTR